MSCPNPSNITFFSFWIALLIAFSLSFTGCVQNSPVQTQALPSPVPNTALSPITTQINLSTELETDTDQSVVNITINSVLRTDVIHGARSGDNNVFIVVDLTIENYQTTDYPFTESSIILNNDIYPNSRVDRFLDTPISWGTVRPGERRRGEVVFDPRKETQKLTMVIIDTNGEVLFTEDLNEGALTGYATSKSEKLRVLMKNTNFTDVIRQLDTPLLAAQYTDEKFKYSDDGSCEGYTPQEFFISQRGDCSDFSGFFAYALAAHGYDAKKISFKYYNSEGSFRGHVVAVFTEKDGQLRYATIPDLTLFRNITSLDDLIGQEKIRLGFKDIVGEYKIHDPESTDVCHYKSLSEIPTQNKKIS